MTGVIRCYRELDEASVEWELYEYWTATELRYYRRQASQVEGELEEVSQQFTNQEGLMVNASAISHPFGRVPFIEFPNNSLRLGDLQKYKGLIDLYDKIISGFGNDLEDIQEVIFVLKNYGREPLPEMLQNLKLFKAVKLEDGEGGSYLYPGSYQQRAGERSGGEDAGRCGQRSDYPAEPGLGGRCGAGAKTVGGGEAGNPAP